MAYRFKMTHHNMYLTKFTNEVDNAQKLITIKTNKLNSINESFNTANKELKMKMVTNKPKPETIRKE